MNVLELSASGRHDDSVSRMLAEQLVDSLEDRHGEVERVRRDLGDGVPFVDDAWIDANFTPAEKRTDAQRDALRHSDEMVAELERADVIVIGTPIYNFGIPASLKAWVDMIARARRTFRYTESGPEGLLRGKQAYVVVTSGGVAVGGPLDFATPYLRHALAFVGITDVEVIAAGQLNSRRAESLDEARAQIADLVHTGAARPQAA
jgi:FMN-dependent NADH-azoreductase